MECRFSVRPGQPKEMAPRILYRLEWVTSWDGHKYPGQTTPTWTFPFDFGPKWIFGVMESTYSLWPESVVNPETTMWAQVFCELVVNEAKLSFLLLIQIKGKKSLFLNAVCRPQFCTWHLFMNHRSEIFILEGFAWIFKEDCNLGQNKMEQLSPIPPKQWWRREGAKMRHFGIIEMGGGVVQMFHLFCPRLYLRFHRDKTKGASN